MDDKRSKSKHPFISQSFILHVPVGHLLCSSPCAVLRMKSANKTDEIPMHLQLIFQWEGTQNKNQNIITDYFKS